jgi:hypothetical protein
MSLVDILLIISATPHATIKHIYIHEADCVVYWQLCCLWIYIGCVCIKNKKIYIKKIKKYNIIQYLTLVFHGIVVSRR